MSPSTPGETERQVSMYAYPWDLHDPDPASSARWLKDAGFNTVHVAHTYHVGTYFLPRSTRGPVRYGNLGAAYFHPEASLYDGAGVTPITADEVAADPDYMVRLLSALAAEGLAVRPWVLYCYNHAMGTAYPHLCKRDAFDTPYLAQLCVGNPAVRSLARALTDDVLNGEGVDGLFIESLCFFRYDYGLINNKRAVNPSPRAAKLLALCFCEGCTAAARDAGIDTVSFQEEVAAAISDDLAAQPLPDDRQPPADAPWQEEAFGGVLARYQAVRDELAASLVEEVMEKAHGRGSGFKVGLFNWGEFSPGERQRLQQRLDEALVKPSDDVEVMRQRIHQARDGYGPEVLTIAAVYPRDLADAATFAARLAACKEAGVDGFRVYNYGILSQRQLDWLAEAEWA